MSEDTVGQSLNSKQINRRGFIKLAGLAGGGLFLASCAPAAPAPSPTAAPKEAPKESPKATAEPKASAPPPKPKVSANLEFAASAGGIALIMLPVIVADEAGFLKEEGITQKITVFQGGGDIVRGILQGGLPLGNPSNVTVAQAFEQGEALKIVAENAPFITAAWIVREDSPIKSMKDIKGKKFGYTAPGSESQIFALTALKSLGFKEGEDVQLVSVRGIPDQYTALKNGIIDVAWSVDPIITQGVLAKEVRLLASPNEFVNYWSQCMIVTTADYAKANADVVSAYIWAYIKAMDFIKSSTDQAADIWAKAAKVSPDITKIAIKNYPIQKFTAQLNPNIFKSLTELMLANKLVKQAPPWDKIVDQNYLPANLRVNLT